MWTCWNRCVVFIACVFLWGHVLADEFDITSVGYSEFVKLALESDPMLSRLRNEADQARHNAAAANSLPDPIVTIGLDDVSSQLGITEETKTVVGIQQTFPSWGMLDSESASMTAESKAKLFEADDRRLKVELDATAAWLEMYYAYASQQFVIASRKVFEEMLRVAQLRYRNGRGTQGDVIEAQVEIVRLDNRVTEFEMTKDMMSARLGSWVAAASVRWKARPEFPDLGAIQSYDSLRESIREHPSVVSADAMVAAGLAAVDLAKSRYLPETMFEFTYTRRDIDESAMLAGMLSFSIPLFPPRRQDRWVGASRARVEGAKDEAKARRRELQLMLEEEYRRWQRTDELLQRFEKELLPYVSQFSQATLNSYQAAVVDFDTLVKARVQELDTKLEALRVQVDRAKAQASLKYLSGGRAQ